MQAISLQTRPLKFSAVRLSPYPTIEVTNPEVSTLATVFDLKGDPFSRTLDKANIVLLGGNRIILQLGLNGQERILRTPEQIAFIQDCIAKVFAPITTTLQYMLPTPPSTLQRLTSQLRERRPWKRDR